MDFAHHYDQSIALTHATRAVSPGGAQTMSKQPARFVEGAFPAYLARGQGARVWDVDGHEYVDWICGLGAVPLGHQYLAVDIAIYKQLTRGLISPSLPTELEEEVAAKLVQMIPCARDRGQVRFVKTGSEACAAAVRIARRATGRNHVIVVGYHGWHDWVMQTADPHPGIVPDGKVHRVPYNDAGAIEDTIKRLRDLRVSYQQVAAVMLEPTLLEPPEPGYLQAVVDLCHKYGALSIFDEMVTGFRWATAGGQEYFGVTPDLAVFGKGLANGMPLACIVGPERIMRYADVISGTFGGECLSLAAASAVLDVYHTISPEHPCNQQWRDGAWFLDTCLDLGIPTTGVGVHPKITFAEDVMPVFLQETALRGLLLHPAGFNVSAALTLADKEVTATALRGAMDALKEGATLHGTAPRAGAFARTT